MTGDFDGGRISRRTLLAGAAGAVVVLGGGTAAGKYEIDHHPGLRKRIFGCGSTPPIPPTNYVIVRGTYSSRAMRRNIPWAVARPKSELGQSLPLVLALAGLDATELEFADQIGLPGFATAAHQNFCFVSAGAVGSCYYHPRADGTNYLAFLVDELLPMVENRFEVGGDRSRRAVYGSSMGGFGALLIAQQRPDLICAAAAASPAVFPSYHAAVTGHPDTFDSAADWSRWGLWEHASSMGAVPVRIDCGNADPFGATASQLLTTIPGAVGHVGFGCHDTGFWRRNAPAGLAFIAHQLGGG